MIIFAITLSKLTENSSLRFKKKLKRKRLDRVIRQDDVALLERMSWKSILSKPPSLLSFCPGTIYDTLPSPSNLHKWNIINKTSCNLCHKQISIFQSFSSSYTVSKTNRNTSIKFIKTTEVNKKETWYVILHTRLKVTLSS